MSMAGGNSLSWAFDGEKRERKKQRKQRRRGNEEMERGWMRRRGNEEMKRGWMRRRGDEEKGRQLAGEERWRINAEGRIPMTVE